jgi:hypothetical protein
VSIDDVDASLDAGFFDAPDVGARPSLPVTGQQARQVALRQTPLTHVFGRQLRQQVCRIHQRFFGGLTHRRLHFLEHASRDEPPGERDERSVENEQASRQGERPLHSLASRPG